MIKNGKSIFIETGKNTMTGGRLKRLNKYLKNDKFIMTYGDGLSNVNLNKLLNFMIKIKKLLSQLLDLPHGLGI